MRGPSRSPISLSLSLPIQSSVSTLLPSPPHERDEYCVARRMWRECGWKSCPDRRLRLATELSQLESARVMFPDLVCDHKAYGQNLWTYYGEN